MNISALVKQFSDRYEQHDAQNGNDGIDFGVFEDIPGEIIKV